RRPFRRPAAIALAGDLADKKLRNLPAALDLPALTRLPESQRYPPAFGTTIVPVLIAELTKPRSTDRLGSVSDSRFWVGLAAGGSRYLLVCPAFPVGLLSGLSADG